MYIYILKYFTSRNLQDPAVRSQSPSWQRRSRLGGTEMESMRYRGQSNWNRIRLRYLMGL